MVKKSYLILLALMIQGTVVHGALTSADELSGAASPHVVAAAPSYDFDLFANKNARNIAQALTMSAGYHASQYPEVFTALYNILEHRGALTVKDLEQVGSPIILPSLLGIQPKSDAPGFVGLTYDASTACRGSVTVSSSSTRVFAFPPLREPWCPEQ